jgi:TRAP-type C4-dicarboxylate transport system permease small subunit
MRRFYTLVGKAEAVLAGIFLLMMVVLIFSGGIARLMRHPLNWTIDLSTCCFAWACFMCADVAWRHDQIMSIDLVPARLPPQAARILMYCNYLIIAAFLMFCIYSGVWLSWISRARSFQGIPGISYSWVTMSLPVGSLLLLITTAVKFADKIREGRALRSGHRAEPA